MSDKITRPVYGLLDQQLMRDTIEVLQRLLSEDGTIILPLRTHYSAVVLLDDLKREIKREYENHG